MDFARTPTLHVSSSPFVSDRESESDLVSICHARVWMQPYITVHKPRVDYGSFDLGCELMNIAALNSQSSLGSSSGSPAAVGSLEAASPAGSTPLYPAGPSLLAAGPHRSSNPLLGRSPDVQQTRPVLTKSLTDGRTAAVTQTY